MRPLLASHRTLLTLACVLAVAIGLNVLVSLPRYDRAFRPAQQLLTLKQRWDSWYPMMLARYYVLQSYPGKSPLYTHLFFEQRLKFQYPPTSLIFSFGLAKVVRNEVKLMRELTFAFIPVSAFFLLLIYRRVEDSREWVLPALLVSLLTLLFYPVVFAVNLGQIQAWINGMFIILFYCWLRGWHWPAGVLLGLMCLIKPPYGLILLWGAARRKWRFVTAAGVTLLAGALISLWMFGLKNNLDYLPVASYLSRHGESYFANQSMNGLLNRLLFNGVALPWQDNDFPPYHPVVYAGTTLFAAVLALAAFLVPRWKAHAGGMLDLSIIAVTATITSPIAWDHHYGIMLPIFLYLFLILHRARHYRLLAALGLSFALCSLFIGKLNAFATKPFWNLLVSYVFFGGLILLAVLYRTLFRAPAALAGAGERFPQYPL